MSVESLPADFRKTFMTYIKWSKLVGLDILNVDNRVYRKILQAIFCLVLLTSITITPLVQIYNISKDSISGIRGCLTLSINVQNYITFFVILNKSRKIKNMLFEVAKLWPNFEQGGTPQARLFKDWSRRYLLYSTIYARVLIFGVTTFNLVPLPYAIYTYYTQPEPVYQFMIARWRPWAITSMPRFLLGLLYDGLALSIPHLCVHTACIMILTGITFDISLLFRILQIDLEDCFESYNDLNDEKEATKALATIVKTHQQLFRLTEELNDIFGIIVLISYVVSVFFICTTLFLTVVIDTGNIFASFTVFAEIFSLSLSGQLLTETSGNMAEAAYNSMWYKCGKRLCKMVCLIIRRSQNPIKLSGMGYIDASVTTFAAVLRLSWSYFNLLVQVFTMNKN